MKYTFIMEETTTSTHRPLRLVLTFEEVSLPDILREFETFLKGCGFSFNGHLEIVDDEQ